MKRSVVMLLAVLSILLILAGCKKDSNTSGPTDNTPTYPVTAIVLNPQGQPQGGAILTLKNPPSSLPKYTSYTDSAGRATIAAPAGQQTLVAKIGSAFLAEMSVTVQASQAGTVVTTPLRLAQNTNIKVLVVQASAEQLEDVLHVIGFNQFDSTDIYTLRDSANVDSVSVLNKLKNYTLIFSDCDGGSEGSDSYAALSRVYGRYIDQGGKMYGGHYNYYHLQRIWPPYYQTSDYRYAADDSISIIDGALAGFVGFSRARWYGHDGRRLSGYEKFTDLPSGSKTYGVIYGLVNPQVGVIVENYRGAKGGKYLWTDYHNQDVKDDPKLVRIVQYFLLSM